MNNENSESLVQKLQEVKDIHCSEGNWNCNPYMHGMANGIILALAILENKEPVYLEAPEAYMDEAPSDCGLALS